MSLEAESDADNPVLPDTVFISAIRFSNVAWSVEPVAKKKGPVVAVPSAGRLSAAAPINLYVLPPAVTLTSPLSAPLARSELKILFDALKIRPPEAAVDTDSTPVPAIKNAGSVVPFEYV